MTGRLHKERRAAFLLRELFDAGYDEMASVLEKSEAACRQIITGAERVVKMAVGFQRQGRGLVTHQIAHINGEPAVLTLVDGRTLFTTSLAPDGDRITGIYRVLNPDKLRRVGPPPYMAGSGLESCAMSSPRKRGPMFCSANMDSRFRGNDDVGYGRRSGRIDSRFQT